MSKSTSVVVLLAVIAGACLREISSWGSISAFHLLASLLRSYWNRLAFVLAGVFLGWALVGLAVLVALRHLLGISPLGLLLSIRRGSKPPLVGPTQAGPLQCRLLCDDREDETCDWLNNLLEYVVAELLMKPESADEWKRQLTKVLNPPDKPSFLGPIEVTGLITGTSLPIIRRVRVSRLEPKQGTLLAACDLSYDGRASLSLAADLWLHWPVPNLACLPVAASITLTHLKAAVEVACGPAKGATDAVVADISLPVEPELRFELSSSFGEQRSDADTKALTDFALDQIRSLIRTHLVAPNKLQRTFTFPNTPAPTAASVSSRRTGGTPGPGASPSPPASGTRDVAGGHRRSGEWRGGGEGADVVHGPRGSDGPWSGGQGHVAAVPARRDGDTDTQGTATPRSREDSAVDDEMALYARRRPNDSPAGMHTAASRVSPPATLVPSPHSFPKPRASSSSSGGRAGAPDGLVSPGRSSFALKPRSIALALEPHDALVRYGAGEHPGAVAVPSAMPRAEVHRSSSIGGDSVHGSDNGLDSASASESPRPQVHSARKWQAYRESVVHSSSSTLWPFLHSNQHD